MIKQKSTLCLLTMLFISITQAMMDKKEISSLSNIESDCSVKVDPNKNPLEQLLDYVNEKQEKGSRDFYFWLTILSKKVHLIEIASEKGEFSRIEFKRPDRIDLNINPNEIEKAIKTKDELPFAAFRFMRNVRLADTVDIPMGHSPMYPTGRPPLYNTHVKNAGKYGHFLCYNDEDAPLNFVCISLPKFSKCLRLSKPNKKKMLQENV